MYEFARLSPANSYIVPSDPEPPRECDVVVIGAGIVGLAVARELAFRHDGIGVVVLEREPRIAAHQTGRSSGVIHAGIYYAPGSLKARLCVEGARELYAYCGERGIPAKRIGKVIVATRGDELPRLGELERRALANGVPGVERVGPDRLRDLEPRASGVAALYSPHTGVVDFRRVAGAFAEEVVAARGTISSSCGVSALRPDDSGILVEHARGATRARAVVACAGAWSDRLAASAGADTDPRIVPFRGAYMRLRAARRDLVRSNIYPVPDPELPFLGAHFTRTIDGEILLGPSALLVGARDAYELHRIRPRDLADTLGWPGTWRLMGRFWQMGLTEIRHAASKGAFIADLRRFVPELEVRDVLPGPSGVRAQALIDDFVVSRTARALHVRNAPSPAATSSLPLARLIVDRAEEEIEIT